MNLENLSRQIAWTCNGIEETKWPEVAQVLRDTLKTVVGPARLALLNSTPIEMEDESSARVIPDEDAERLAAAIAEWEVEGI